MILYRNIVTNACSRFDENMVTDIAIPSDRRIGQDVSIRPNFRTLADGSTFNHGGGMKSIFGHVNQVFAATALPNCEPTDAAG